MGCQRNFRSVLLRASAITAPLALLAPQAALAQTAPVAPAPGTTSTTSTTTTTTTTTTTEAKPIKALAGSLEPKWGNIRTFWGDVSPYWGNIRTFWGDVNPYEGDLTAFWGNIRTFNDGTTSGSLSPLWGNIRTFSGDIGASWGNIRTFWGNIRTFEEAPQDYISLASQIRGMVDQSASFWGTTVQQQTGKSFGTAFADPMLAKYGINLNDPSSLAKLTMDQRERFFLDWYDGLMNYSGADHVDHWMNAVNWTPKLTQVQGSGIDSVIGLVDFYAANDPDVKNKMIYQGGYNVVNGHGVGVLSLMVASHDGKGVMGIAPNAKIAAFNPFDATGTADWASVRQGIAAVGAKGAAVINLSLGVPGYTFSPEWRAVLNAPDVNSLRNKTIFVIAAGNDGIVQTQSVNMKDALDTVFLVVGSVDPSGNISSFSNTPGMACLLDDKTCKYETAIDKSGYLMNRFIVAPGEFILVSDGKGGVTRMSGTSFAAPLVAGTIALIHDRWPWLKNYPRDVAKAILDSATDLGAPGIDPVYGVGMLNVEAAQSALDFNKLKYYLYDGAKSTEIKVGTLRTTGIQSAWVAKDMYFSAFEELVQSKRDFLIPLSDRLVGTTKNGEYFQEFVYNRFVQWMSGGSGFAPMGVGFSDLRTTPMDGNLNGWRVSVSGRLTNEIPGATDYYRPQLRSTVQATSPSGRFGFAIGQGDGAVFLGGDQAFQMTSDFDPYSGGVNPLLGFASGGAHISSRMQLADGLDVSVGITERRQHLSEDLRDVNDFADRGLISRTGRYASHASTVKVSYQAAPWLGLSSSITRLGEDNALLGVRSLEASDLAGGTTTDGVTFAANASLGGGFNLFGSATGARSHSAGDSASLRIGGGGLLGTSFQVGMAKHKLLSGSDSLRLSLSQPLTVESGSLDVQMVRVIDRQTGEIGVVSERYDISAPERRRFIAEAVYGTDLLDGRGSLSLFGRSELRNVDATMPSVLVGGQMNLAF